MNEAGNERAELLRKIFDPETPGDAVRSALAKVLSLELPPPVGHPVILASTQGLAGYAVGQDSAVTEIRATVRRVLFDDQPFPIRLNVTLRTDGPK